MRYFLTTAIDYVNSRPHLGTAYEKITADVIARYRRLAGVDTCFLMGNDEHSQNVFRRRPGAGQGSAGLLRRDGAGVPRGLEAARHLVRRLHPHDRRQAAFPGRADDGAGLSRQRRHLRGRYEGWYCVGCEAFKPEKDLVDGLCPIHKTKPEWIQREELVLPPVEVPAAAAGALRRQPVVHRAGDAAQRDPAAGRRRPRGHLDEPGRAVVGHPAAVRSDERRLRLVRRARSTTPRRSATAGTTSAVQK